MEAETMEAETMEAETMEAETILPMWACICQECGHEWESEAELDGAGVRHPADRECPVCYGGDLDCVEVGEG